MNARRAPAARTPRAPWRWALLGLVLGALPTLALQAPARWLGAAAERASGAQVQLADARGTVWDGSARLLLTGGRASRDAAALPGRVHWRIRPAWTGARAELRADCCTAAPLALRVAPGWSATQLLLADGQSHWPAGLLAGLGTPWNTVQLQGRLQLTTTGLALSWARGRTRLAGQVRLDLLDMSSRLSTLRPIGSYRVQVAGGDAPTLQLSTLDGALQLSGSGQWVGQRLRFTGEATAAAGREAQLANLLNIIGRRSGARSVITIG